MHLLARREHSIGELKQKLKQKGAAEGDIDAVLVELIEKGYQSDERFAKSYVRCRVQAGFGPLRIRAELQQRQVSPDLIARVLDQAESFWQARLEEIWQRRFHGKLPKNQQEYGRQIRFFLQRGFHSALVTHTIKIKK